MRFRKSKSAGFTLAEVLIAGVILSALFTGYLLFASQFGADATRIRVKDASLRLDDAFRGQILRATQQMLLAGGSCDSPKASFVARLNGTFPSGLAFNLVDGTYASERLQEAVLGSRGRAAKSRCESSQSWMKGSISAERRFYFCVGFSGRDAMELDHSGLSSMDGLFGEFLYSRWDLLASSPLPCNVLSGNPNPPGASVGLLTYTLYWTSALPNGKRVEKTHSSTMALRDY